MNLVAVPAASCGGVSPPARTRGETPGELAGEDALHPPGSSWSQCMVARPRGLPMNQPGHGIATCLGKAAVNTPHSRRFARSGAARQSRSVWSASDLSALSARGTGLDSTS